VLDHPSSTVEGQNARNVCSAIFGGDLHAELGHLETVAQVRSDATEKVGLPGLEVGLPDSRLRSIEPQRYPPEVKTPRIS
jgi:hypothetical protein